MTQLTQPAKFYLTQLDLAFREDKQGKIDISARSGDIYALCLEILRVQASSGRDCLDDDILGHLELPEILSWRDLRVISAVALSQPTEDYEALLDWTLGLNEGHAIVEILKSLITRWGYKKDFYHYLTAQESQDSKLQYIFSLEDVDAIKLVAPFGDRDALCRVASKRRGIEYVVSQALSHFSYQRTLDFRSKLSYSDAVSNSEFVQRFSNLLEYIIGALPQDSVHGPWVPTLSHWESLPGFDKLLERNRYEILKRFFSVSSSAEMWLPHHPGIIDIEQRIISPLLAKENDRLMLFFSFAMKLDHSLCLDINDTPDGGRSRYMRSLIQGLAGQNEKSRLLVRSFVKLESVEELASHCKTDDELLDLYATTGQRYFLSKASSRGRDQALSSDIGL